VSTLKVKLMKKSDLMKVTIVSIVSAFSVAGLAFQTGNVVGSPTVNLSRDTLVRNHLLYDESTEGDTKLSEESDATTLNGWEYTLRPRPPRCNSF